MLIQDGCDLSGDVSAIEPTQQRANIREFVARGSEEIEEPFQAFGDGGDRLGRYHDPRLCASDDHSHECAGETTSRSLITVDTHDTMRFDDAGSLPGR